jgi:hypothetical protein
MRKREYGVIGLFLLCLICVAGYAIAIDWIQYNERLVGEGSSLYPTDVINRPAKQIWTNYTSEHYAADGSHKASIFPTPLPTATPPVFPTPLPTPTPVSLADYVTNTTFQVAHSSTGFLRESYSYDSSGTGNHASGVFAPSGFFIGTNNWGMSSTQWTIVALINFDHLAMAESFYQHTKSEYSENVLNFGKTSDNKLFVTLGTNTVASTTTFFDTLNKNMPMEVAVVCDKTNDTVIFCAEGVCEAAITSVNYSTIPSVTSTEAHIMGGGFHGGFRILGISYAKLFSANSTHSPVQSLAQVRKPLVYYDVARVDDTYPTLTDQVYWQSSYADNRQLTLHVPLQNYFPTW